MLTCACLHIPGVYFHFPISLRIGQNAKLQNQIDSDNHLHLFAESHYSSAAAVEISIQDPLFHLSVYKTDNMANMYLPLTQALICMVNFDKLLSHRSEKDAALIKTVKGNSHPTLSFSQIQLLCCWPK